MFLRIVALAALGSLAWCQALEQAKRAFDGGDYAEAARLFEQAHQASPSCEILFYLGLAQYRQKQPGAAIISFQSAVQCDPKLVPAHLALAEAYSERGNAAEALSSYTRALSLEPRNSAALSGAASIYLMSKSNEKAVELLETLVAVNAARNADDPQAHVDLGAAYAATGDSVRAEPQFQAALRLQPDNPSALMGLGNLALKNGEEDRAIELLKKAVQAAPNSFEPRYLLGSAYNRQARYEEALTELQSAVRLGANESEVYYHLARAYGGLGRQNERSKALARFAELTRQSKQDIEDQRTARKLIDEVKSLVQDGDLRVAVARMEAARELRPSDDRLLFRLAGLHYDLQRYDAARNYAQEAISLAPSEWLYHYLLGLVEKQSGKLAQARSSLETAVRLNPSAAEAHNALGEVALREGDRPRAIACFQRAAELDPKEQAYKLNLDAARRAESQKR